AASTFIDDLSTWYIRRNRRRFWRSRDAADQDKLAAYQTLYDVLVTLVKLLAPCLPFLTERMYQNLVRSWDETAPESVHLCDYPDVDPSLLDPRLNAEMAAAQRVVRLGHKLRDAANLRVRQPLPELRFVATDSAERDAVVRLADLVREELNVKRITPCESLDDLVHYVYKPNLKTLGPKYGKLLGAIREELAKGDAARLATLRQGESVELAIAGQTVVLLPEDVLIETRQAQDWLCASDRDLQVALSTAISPELKREGMARDFVRHVQQLRKEKNLEIEDHILVYWHTDSDEVRAALGEWDGYIRTETLAERLDCQPAPTDQAKRVTVGDAKAAVWIQRA
ncbi:MAG TPA: isoleucine--tRNA ligase, partial [Planctomycetaceae bacterium]|nr:isoleucine--tRNA ligase [Planctomycetaceae bacterium]